MKTSRYFPIWKALRETGTCRITAPVQFHKRIIKGVKKQRDSDVAYRYLLAEKNRTHEILIRKNGTVINFQLLERITLNGL